MVTAFHWLRPGIQHNKTLISSGHQKQQLCRCQAAELGSRRSRRPPPLIVAAVVRVAAATRALLHRPRRPRLLCHLPLCRSFCPHRLPLPAFICEHSGRCGLQPWAQREGGGSIWRRRPHSPPGDPLRSFWACRISPSASASRSSSEKISCVGGAEEPSHSYSGRRAGEGIKILKILIKTKANAHLCKTLLNHRLVSESLFSSFPSRSTSRSLPCPSSSSSSSTLKDTLQHERRPRSDRAA